MKKFALLLPAVMFLVCFANPISAQEKGRISFQYGLGYKVTWDPFISEAGPVFGVGFKLDEANTIGIGAQLDFFIKQQDLSPVRDSETALPALYSYYLHDFNSGRPVFFFTEYKLGVADVLQPGVMIGIEPGIGFKTSASSSLRLGLLLQSASLNYQNSSGTKYRTMEYAAGVSVKLIL